MATAYVQGGAKLERALSDMARHVKNASQLRVGFPEGAQEDDGTPTAMVAAIQEFGAPRVGIPPRPFFRNMIAKRSPGWPDQLAAILKANDLDARASLEMFGMIVAAQLQESIIDTDAPPLSPITLMLRRMKSEDQSLVVTARTVGEAARRVAAGEGFAGASTKPLIETGVMLRSVKSVVS